MDRFETLLTAYLEGPLEPDAAAELAELVKGQLIHRKRFLFQSEVNGLLWAHHASRERGAAMAERTLRCLPGAAQAEAAVNDVMDLVRALPREKPTAAPIEAPLRPRRHWSIAPGWLAAAVVVLIFGPALWMAYSLFSGQVHPIDFAAIATLRASSGQTQLILPFSEQREPVRPGQGLLLAKGIETLGTARIEFRDGTLLTLNGGEFPARIWLRNTQPGAVQHREHSFGKRVTVELGRVHCDVTRQPAGEPMIVITPHLEVEVVGTSFSVDVTALRSTVQVEEGAVRVLRMEDRRVVMLRKGQSVSTSEADFKALETPAP